MTLHPYAYPIISALFWTVATQFFARAGHKMPVRRLNLLKSWISVSLFATVCLFSSGFAVNSFSLLWLVFSGVIGFALGDMLIFYAFTRMGPARTMIIGSFQPVIIALFSFALFGRSVSLPQFLGIGCMILCVITLSQEKKQRKNVNWKILLIALAGMSLDALGVVFSKQAFILDPSLDSFTANFYRILSAIPVMTIFNWKIGFWKQLKNVSRLGLIQAAIGTILGTFLALYFYLAGISKASAPTVAALTLCAPLLASTYEHILEKCRPSKYFIVAVIFMLTGIGILVLGK